MHNCAPVRGGRTSGRSARLLPRNRPLRPVSRRRRRPGDRRHRQGVANHEQFVGVHGGRPRARLRRRRRADRHGVRAVPSHRHGLATRRARHSRDRRLRGEGGVLKNAKGERFMFRYMPEMFKGDFAETEAEADAWVKGDRKQNRRPPELLTRDVVAKAIVREIAEGRGTEHGGVLLDIASKQSPDYIKQKLPSMYHQFKELAHVDITKVAMEIGPTTHYVMGGVRVDAETQESTVPGLFA